MFDAVLIGSIGSRVACTLIFLTSLFLILLVLVQRGRGGGLSGAFGGMGGQSAFGAKAGDTFTRVTVVVASCWIVLCILTAKFIGSNQQSRFATAAGGEQRAPSNPEDGTTADDGATSLTTESPATEPPATGPGPVNPAAADSLPAESDNDDFDDSDIPSGTPADAASVEDPKPEAPDP